MLAEPDPLDSDDDEYVAPPRVIEREWEALDWQDRALCSGEGPELFVGPAGERPEERLSREQFVLDAFCARCPVRRDCMTFGRRHREFGVWGETDFERARAGFGPTKSTERQVAKLNTLARMRRQGLVAE